MNLKLSKSSMCTGPLVILAGLRMMLLTKTPKPYWLRMCTMLIYLGRYGALPSIHYFQVYIIHLFNITLVIGLTLLKDNMDTDIVVFMLIY